MSANLALALAQWNSANERARRAYYAEPNACADWRPACVQPRGTTKACVHCRDVLRSRRNRAKRKAARR